MALLNYSQVAKILHYSSYNSAKNRIAKYKKELKQYIHYDKKGKFIGYDENGIEELRNIGTQYKSSKRDNFNYQLELLKQDNSRLEEIKNRLQVENEDLKNRIYKLEEENKALMSSLGFFGLRKYQRLLTYQKK